MMTYFVIYILVIISYYYCAVFGGRGVEYVELNIM